MNSKSGRGGQAGGRGGQAGGSGSQKKPSQTNKTKYFIEHIDESTYVSGSGTRFFFGKLRVNPRKNSEAYVRCEGFNIDFKIDDDKTRNRSLHGDVVAVEVLPEEQWSPWSAMMQAKLDVGIDIGIDSPTKSGGAGAGTQEKLTRLWNPEQDMIDSMRERARTESGSSKYGKKMGGGGDTGKVAGAGAEAEADAEFFPAPSKDKDSDSHHEKDEGKHAVELRSDELLLQPRARVVRILEYNRKCTLVGSLTLNYTPVDGQELPSTERVAFFESQDSLFPKMFVPRMSLPEAFTANPYNGIRQLYLMDICKDWSIHSRMSMGENLRSIGEIGNIATETQALLDMYGNNHAPYTIEALAPLGEILGKFGVTEECESGSETWCIPEDEINRRRDLRKYRIFTIDPPNAKDLDDALHITLLEDGTYELGVHIADVSYFLQPDTALDKEAQNRATSVYLVQKVIPMLPALLCEQLCSLNPNVDRLAFSCIWRMNADGTICSEHKPWFGKTVIRSCAKLDYATAQRMIDGEIPSAPDSGSNADAFLESLPENIWEMNRRPQKAEQGGKFDGHAAWACAHDVILMNKLAMGRRKQRLGTGALVLDKKKLVFVRNEEGNPIDTSSYIIRESNQLVEEYMLLANYLVAQELLVKFGEAAFIRSHGDPDVAGMKSMQGVFSQLGFEFDSTNAQTISASLNNVARSANAETMRIVTQMLAKPIPEAQYLVAGLDPDKWKHFALSIPYYTHFTSPIRRYADVMVHRLLELSVRVCAQQQEGVESTPEEIEAFLSAMRQPAMMAKASAIADKCNEMNKASKKAQERSDRVYFSLFLKNTPIDVSGYVVGIGEKSFTVFVPKYSVEDRIFVDHMVGVTHKYHASTETLQLHRPAIVSPDAVAAYPSALPNKLTFSGTLHLHILSPVRVHLSTKMLPKLDVGMSFIGPDDRAIELGRDPDAGPEMIRSLSLESDV